MKNKHTILFALFCLVFPVAFAITVQNDPIWAANKRKERLYNELHREERKPTLSYNLPQFGRYVDDLGIVRGSQSSHFDEMRPPQERILEWSKPCFIKKPVRQITRDMIENWRNANLPKLNKKYANLNQAEQARKLENIISYIAIEYYVYGLDEKKTISAVLPLRKLYKDTRTWNVLSGRPSVKTQRERAASVFKKRIEQATIAIDNLMLPLENIHKKEFQEWRESNPRQYAELKRADDDLVYNALTLAKIDEARKASISSEIQGLNAEIAAHYAEMAARDAEAVARDAELSAREVQNNTDMDIFHR